MPLLAANGHRVSAPDLRDAPARAGLDVMSARAEHVAALIERQKEKVILVGHSLGGAIISRVAEMAPERIARLVYLAALLSPSGSDIASMPVTEDAPPLVFQADGTTFIFDPATAHETLFHDCPMPDAFAAMKRLHPEPVEVLRAQMPLLSDRYESVARAYIVTALDRAIAPEHQLAMIAAMPCAQVETVESGHSPFYSMAEGLTDMLVSLA